ncbi:choice-of-anchor L domain-containing protein [Christiangramia sp. SM2212]|uniref:Choice-of-anchor L domain-containing protein n=1 Tax=Christiangramia sediminicola TaxID=3073267 RepID=A0ABU1EPQ1_9FLAO|nr:choice-of-anchor L domain-containing protein [Christiangramia sp. SM2212]MDR5590371.1 choice-of-anchor L domain-containing protein [Christiangramia sp. SM2212]
MKKLVLLFLFPFMAVGQSMAIDEDRYSPQELIEQLLVDSPCITNVKVTEAAGGNFTDNSKSFGYFNANGSDFPIREGIVLSTGKLKSITQSTSILSDDDAPGWDGDEDLDSEFNVETFNATILEFDFVPEVSRISFKYLFASEEFQFDNSMTCRFSDVFAFFIKPVSAANYENIALVPNTQTPVSSTTIHPYISDNCRAINENYFDRFNTDAETVFDGQTKVLTASANVNTGEVYHVKLVIADDFNAKFDSAVFIEAGSFQPTIDLGPDKLMSTENALCGGESFEIKPSISGNASLQWFRNGELLEDENGESLSVDTSGVYSLRCESGNSCISYGEVQIEFYPEIQLNSAELFSCGFPDDETGNFNLKDSATQIINPSSRNEISGFYRNPANALSDTDAIENPEDFQSDETTVFARVQNSFGCVEIAEIQLILESNNVLKAEDYSVCDDFPIDGISNIDLALVTQSFIDDLPENTEVSFYLSKDDARNDTNQVTGNFTNIIAFEQKLFYKITISDSCFGFSSINLKIVRGPELIEDETIAVCLNVDIAETILNAGLQGSLDNANFSWYYNGTQLNENQNTINAIGIGTYKVEVSEDGTCISSREIELEYSETGSIDEIKIESNGSSNSVEILIDGNAEYEYAIDSSVYQDSEIFNNVNAGIHTIYARNKNGCETLAKEISVFGYDKFFSPNGDGINDLWKVRGANSNYTVMIYDRYGKFLKKLDTTSSGWNGDINNRPAASGDYWFSLILDSGEIIKGHFSLIR